MALPFACHGLHKYCGGVPERSFAIDLILAIEG